MYDSSTFNDAANYCTQHLKANAYQNIGQRNAYYEWVDSKVAINSRWFGAAEIVTKWNAVGAADNVNAWYLNDPADAFLKAGNKYLFPFNMANAKSIINTGGLTGTFIDANGATVNFNGLKNKALDYAMVKLEQSKVQDFIKIYKTSNPSADMNSVMSSINFSMTSKWAPSEIVKVISENFESTKLGQHSFDFTNYNDRVILGQKIVDQLYK